MPGPLDWIDDALADLERRGLRRRPMARAGPQRGDRIEIDGQSLVNFGSNDYLGLAADPEMVAAVRAALDESAWGAGASPLVTGRSALHQKLERELPAFEGAEAALLFPTGFAANVGTIAALVGTGDAVFSDAKNHASIIDGCRLSGAEIHIYRHGNVDHLRELLTSARSFRRRLIVSDTLFSMDGDFAPLPALAQLAEDYRAMLMVDEAHATGVFGSSGRGLCEHFDVEKGVDIRVGTLSKALGSMGGFVAGQQKLIDWLANRARTYIFSTAAPAAVAAAGCTAVALVRNQPRRRAVLLEHAGRLRHMLVREGFRIGASQSQIIPVILGEAARTMAASGELRRRGFFVPGIRPPSVPEGESLLRISLTYLHSDEQIDGLVAALGKVAK